MLFLTKSDSINDKPVVVGNIASITSAKSRGMYGIQLSSFLKDQTGKEFSSLKVTPI